VEEKELIERFRSGYEAFNRGDFDAAMEMVGPEFEFVRPGGLPPLQGRDAMREWMEPNAFSEQEVEPLDFTVNGDKVLLHQRLRARGAGSGIEFDVEAWAVWHVDEDGRAKRVEGFLAHEEDKARAAAGLSGPRG